MKIVKLYTDGGSRWNPGKSGCGIYITDGYDEKIEARYKAIGIATNNQAEYTAMLLWVRRSIEIGADRIHAFADSELMIHQLTGKYKIKNPELKKIAEEIQAIIREWGGQIKFTHIRREFNIEADRLSNVAMDQL